MRCAICQQEIVTENPKRYFCQKCWVQWNEAILNKASWITYCINDEHQQRRQALNNRELIYLGSEFDVGDFNGEYRLVPTKEYYEEWD